MATLITDEVTVDVPARVSDGAFVIEAADLPRATGWDLKPQGLCRGEVCVPVRGAQLGADGTVDLHAVADALRRPLAVDADAQVAVLGASAAERAAERAAMRVDDFTLTDLDGRPFRWSSLGRRKKLLFAWASW
jgi:hypothetical protein